jgi:Circularly permutated YpsA SLOG family
VSLFNAGSENDFTLLEEDGEYYVNFGDRTGTYREFLRMLFPEDELHSDFLTGSVTANFFALMKEVSERWKDQMKAELLYAKPVGRTIGNRRKLEMMKKMVERIVSGGQTGADRAALDFAIEHGLKHGGWCPKGRRAEDGRIPSRYELEGDANNQLHPANRMERQGLRRHGDFHDYGCADRRLEEDGGFGQETPQAVSSSLRGRNC